MTHLYIELNTGSTEEVNSSIISKLYELAISGDLDNTSDLKGRLHTTVCKDLHFNYLTGSVNGTKRFPELYITADTFGITFADSFVESKLASYIGDGEMVTQDDILAFINSGISFGLSYNNPHSNSTKTWVQVYGDKIQINTFDEFSKFNGVTSINNGAFETCMNLTSIQIPNTITTLGNSAFLTCSKLTELNFGPNLQNIGDSVFSSCTALTEVTGLSNLTSIPNNAFNSCTNLSNIDIDWSKITSMGTNAFRNCPIGAGLTLELNLTNQTGHFGAAFRGTNFDKLIIHCNTAIDGDTNRPVLSLMEYVTYIDASDFILHTVNGYSQSTIFGDNSLVTCIYPPSVDLILVANGGFRNALGTFRYMIILNTTPPDINNDVNNPLSRQFPQNSVLHIYVPDSAVSTYLADSKWSQLGGENGTDTILLRLHGLSELPAGVWTTGLASQYLTQAQLATT